MLAFDTDTLPKRHRAEAMASAMRDTTLSSHLVHHDPTVDVYMRMHVWEFGAVALQWVECSGMTLMRTAKQTAADDSEVVVICLNAQGESVQAQAGSEVHTESGELFAVEMTRPYESHNFGPVSSWVLRLPAEQLGLSPDIVAQARVQLSTSMVNELFLNHLKVMTRQADVLVTDPAAHMIGAVTADLSRALLASASHDDRLASEALADTLVLRVRAYIRDHLHDPRLNAAVIAGVHHVSERHLYKVCADAGMRLEQWIITQRLEGARRDLALRAYRHRTIAATAQRWGFTNASHFTSRFRAAYGMSPRAWKQLSAELN